MNLLKVTKYYPQNNYLKSLIKYFWVLRSDQEEFLEHKLLPVNNIDIVLNFSASMNYSAREKSEVTPKYSFNGIRDRYFIVNQVGKLNVYGVSFFPAGFYPLLKTPLSEYSNKTVDLSLVINEFHLKIEENFNPDVAVSQQVRILEDLFLQLIDPQFIPEKRIFRLINTFYEKIDSLTIAGFSENYGVNQRKLERIFQRYIGTSPKAFQRINRFQAVLNRLINLVQHRNPGPVGQVRVQ